MQTAQKLSIFLLLLVMLSSPAITFATNGIFLIGYGERSRGMGGTAIASSGDAMAGAVNPATIVDATGKNAARIEGDMTLFLPEREATLGGITSKSGSEQFLIPAGAAVYRFNRKLSFGFSAVGVGGGNTRYNKNLYNLVQYPNGGGPPNTDTLGINLIMLQMNPTVAYNINKQNAIGASLVIGVNQFRAYGLGDFTTFTLSQTGDNLTNRGNDYSYGAGVRLGWRGKFYNKRLTLGAAYSSKVYMTKFDKYKEAFADHGSLDTPAMIGVGAAFDITDRFRTAVDIVRVFYSDVAAVSNIGPNTSGNVFPESKEKNALGQPDGLGFGWEDQTIYKLGFEYDYNQNLTLRAGWDYAKSPIDEKREIAFNILAPATVQNHATVGFTYNINKTTDISAAYVHAFKYEQEGPTYIGNTGKIWMKQNAIGVGIGIKM